MEWMHLLLWIAAAGLATSTGFLGLVVLATLRFRRKGALSAVQPQGLPPVTLLKPLCGLEPNLEANLTSFFQQDYTKFEIIFGVRDATDPALESDDLDRSGPSLRPGTGQDCLLGGAQTRKRQGLFAHKDVCGGLV